MNLKNNLRKIAFVSGLNARIKSALTIRQYRSTCRAYSKVPFIVEHATLYRAIELEKRKALQIFFLGTDEQQDFSGCIQALEKLGRVRLFTRTDGSYGQNDPRPESIRRSANAKRLWELFNINAESGWIPDILITQTWSTLIDPTVFDRIRERFCTLIVNIGMDDRHQFRGNRIGNSWGGTLGLIGHIDLALTAAPECVSWYEKEGCPALFFPEASDPDIFHPMPELPKIHDVSFVGACYGIRRDIVMALRKAGIAVTAYGSGWDSGRLPTGDVPRLFAQSKIILGVGTIGHCRDFYALKMRDFDGPMSGSLYVTHDNPDLRSLFEVGSEIITYRKISDCVAKIAHFLGDEDAREKIAARGHARAVADHTWFGRFASLFKTIGLHA